nr:DUF4192 family protein [Glycomyces sp. L485]
MQSYVACGDIASLEPGEILGLVPYLIGRQPVAELVGIGLRNDRPCALRTKRLPAILGNPTGAEQFAYWWRATGTDELRLIAYGPELADGFEALSRAIAALAACGITDQARPLVVTPDRHRWAYFEDRTLESDPGELPEIDCPRPAWGRLGALAFHTACTAAREAEALAPLADAQTRRECAQAQQLATDLLAVTDAAEAPPGDDRPHLEAAMRSETAPPAAEAVYLGVALATDPGLCDFAVQAIWEADTAAEAHLGLWCQIACHTTGTPRAVAAALAALAAWRGEDPLVAEAVRAAREADKFGLAIVEAVEAIVGTGVPAAYLDGVDTLDASVPSGTAATQPMRSKEVA